MTSEGLKRNPTSYCPKTWDFFFNHLKIKSVLDLSDGRASDFFEPLCSTKRLYAPIQLPVVENCDMAWIEHDASYCDLISTSVKCCPKYLFFTPIDGDLSFWCYWFAQYGMKLCPKLTRMARTVALLEDQKNNFAQKGLVFIPKNFKPNKMDVVITWASGNEFCKLPSLKVFVNSLNSCGFAGDKLVFTHDMSIEFREYLEDRGFQIVDVLPSEVHVVIRDRFLAWHHYLTEHKYRYVMLMDFKDVLFQRNPVEYLSQSTSTNLWFVSEGKLHKECDWNSNDQLKLQKHKFETACSSAFEYPKEVWEDWDVLCGGTILGLADSVKNLILSIWSLNVGTPSSDQAALNFLYQRFYHLDTDVSVADPSFCPLVATADLPKNPPPTYSHGRLYHSLLDEQYFVWHQWDRTVHARNILELFG